MYPSRQMIIKSSDGQLRTNIAPYSLMLLLFTISNIGTVIAPFRRQKGYHVGESSRSGTRMGPFHCEPDLSEEKARAKIVPILYTWKGINTSRLETLSNHRPINKNCRQT